MTFENDFIDILSEDYWFKIVGFLEQNWALIDAGSEGYTIYFFGDRSGVFDRLHYLTQQEAEVALKRNGFSRYSEDAENQKFIATPKPPFHEESHPNGLIYSSGKFWK